VNPRDEHSDEDRAWRDIVEHYGDAPEVDEPARPEPEQRPEPPEESDAWNPVSWEDEGRFVPPTPAPVPLAEPRRLLAWAGLIAAPLILLIVVVFGWTAPSWLVSMMILWFIGGFGYLVWTMQSGPRDPGDNGARI
jgi:hypothetical protein